MERERQSCDDAANNQLRGIKHSTGTKCKICGKISNSWHELCKHIRWHSINSQIATPVKKGFNSEAVWKYCICGSLSGPSRLNVIVIGNHLVFNNIS